MKIQIGKHEVGDGCKPFIVAEVGSNWRTFDDCKHSIQMAKQVGADAVKFQAFTTESLYGYSPEQESKHRLPLDWLPKLKEKADACGVEFICSAFSPELIEAVDPYVNTHKVASAELTHIRMLEKLRKIGKPVILSTGASGLQDIKNALEVLDPTPVILMYCVSAYPAVAVRRSRLKHLKSTFGTLVGFSDHTKDAGLVGQAMVEAGACVIEKHVNFVGADTPDSPHSLTLEQFQYMVKTLKGDDQFSWGSGEETEMILRHNRRLLAITDISVGEMLHEGKNFGIYRSLKDDTRALSPWCIDDVNGKTAQKAIQAGSGIGPGDFA